jgi:hypothetical protein
MDEIYVWAQTYISTVMNTSNEKALRNNSQILFRSNKKIKGKLKIAWSFFVEKPLTLS